MKLKSLIRKKYVPVLEQLGFQWYPVPGVPVEDFRSESDNFSIRFGAFHMRPSHMYADYTYPYPGPMFSLRDTPSKYLLTKNVFYQTQDELNCLVDSVLEDTVSFFIPVMRKLRPHVVAENQDLCSLYCNECGAAEFASKFHLPTPSYDDDLQMLFPKLFDIFSSWIAPDIDLRTECYQAHEIDLYHMGAYLGEWKRLQLQTEYTVKSWQWVEQKYDYGNEISRQMEWGLAFWVTGDGEGERTLSVINPMIHLLSAWNHYPYYDDNPFEHMGLLV